MSKRSRGTCRFCGKSVAGSHMGRHLGSCPEKRTSDVEEASKTRRKRLDEIYHIRVRGGGPYWLDLEARGSATLEDLDRFLRSVWLECCGHLSEFEIEGYRFSNVPDDDSFDEPAYPMTQKLDRALEVGIRFRHIYDFGSTTELEGNVVGVRQGILKPEVRILARNDPPEYSCVTCDAQAVGVCACCYEPVCDECEEDHECGEEMILPLVNSPRTGVCGYTGGFDPDRDEASGG